MRLREELDATRDLVQWNWNNATAEAAIAAALVYIGDCIRAHADTLKYQVLHPIAHDPEKKTP